MQTSNSDFLLKQTIREVIQSIELELDTCRHPKIVKGTKDCEIWSGGPNDRGEIIGPYTSIGSDDPGTPIQNWLNQNFERFNRQFGCKNLFSRGYYRWISSNDPSTEFNSVESGNIQPSTNHRIDKVEDGMAVCRGIWHYWHSANWVYIVDGNLSSELGSDDEPLIKSDPTILCQPIKRPEALSRYCTINLPSLIRVINELRISPENAIRLMLGLWENYKTDGENAQIGH